MKIQRFWGLLAALLLVSPAHSGANIGFFSPQGVLPAFVAKTDFAMINAMNVEQVRQSMALAKQNAPFTVNIDFGPVLCNIKPRQALATSYVSKDGRQHHKALPALADNKIRVFPSNAQIETRLRPFLEVMQAHAPQVGTVFLADEPYLNGISKQELERAGAKVRSLLQAFHLPKVKIGVIFASAMFNQEFAQHINRAAGEYALGIDNYYSAPPKFANPAEHNAYQQWRKTIQSARLTTYDSAGNMFVRGGLPKGFDVVGFDFYLSTILLDALHEDTLAWLAQRFPQQCGKFKDKTMRQVRKQLSFFQDGPVVQGDAARVADRSLLDDIFQCRMTATLALLKAEIKHSDTPDRQILLIAESSNNGLFEFDAAGNIEPGQPVKLVESRVLDEVKRAMKLYQTAKSDFAAGLMFFTFQNEYDNTIKMPVGGASGMGSVMEAIYSLH